MQSNTVKAFSLILNEEMTNISSPMQPFNLLYISMKKLKTLHIEDIIYLMSFLIQMMNYSEKSF